MTKKSDQLAAMLARVMTLPKASVLHGKPKAYYTLRRATWRDHANADLRFPEPVRTSNGAEEFDILELALWDARRKQATPQGRATIEEHDSE